MNTGNGGTRTFAALFKDLADNSAGLLRGELRLARIELTAITSNVTRGSAEVALGGVLLVLGVLAFATGMVLLVGDQWLPKDRYWLAAFGVMVVTTTLAAWFATKGMAHLSPSQLAPAETLETLKEDTEWLRQQLTSGATSS